MLQVYGETSVGKESGCNEMSTLEPTNPYSAAKAGAGQQAPLCTYSFRAVGAICLWAGSGTWKLILLQSCQCCTAGVHCLQSHFETICRYDNEGMHEHILHAVNSFVLGHE